MLLDAPSHDPGGWHTDGKTLYVMRIGGDNDPAAMEDAHSDHMRVDDVLAASRRRVKDGPNLTSEGKVSGHHRDRRALPRNWGTSGEC
jgi:hypothetical protein